jgi:hypothetical protein
MPTITCLCESELCTHHGDDPCPNPTTDRDNTRTLGNVCATCRTNYAEAGYPLMLTPTALQAIDAEDFAR